MLTDILLALIFMALVGIAAIGGQLLAETRIASLRAHGVLEELKNYQAVLDYLAERVAALEVKARV